MDVTERFRRRAPGSGSWAVGVVATLLFAACDTSTAPEATGEIAAFVEVMNEHRASVGCAPLGWVDVMADVAQAHSEDMVERGFFDHTNPDGESPFDRMTAAGIDYTGAAENIAYGYSTGASVLQGWLDSPGHRANIEDCSLTEHGVGLHQTYWTHLFRTP